MPLYSYKAIDAQGRSVMGRVEAVNLFDLEQRLSRMGLDLINGAPSSTRSRLIGGSRVTRPDLINFCFHLEQLATALASGFRTLADDGARLVRAGTTSLDELMRVVDLTDRMT